MIAPNPENNRPLFMRKILSATLPLVVALACGCGKRETFRSPDGKIKVEQKGDTAQYEVTTKDGKATFTASDSGVAIPETFPKDVPVPKGAVPKLSMTQGKSELLHLRVSGSIADAAKDYQDQLKGAGWEIETSMNMAEAFMLQAKKDSRRCAAVVVKDDAQTLIQLTVSQE